MTRIFISHSSTDDEFVTRLAGDLRAAGIETWVDHQDIVSGQNWSRAIEQALVDCDTMIVVLSAAAVDSEEVEAEWRYYLSQNKRLLPIKIDACTVPYRLGTVQYLDFEHDYGRGLQNLLGGLDAHFAEESSVTGGIPVLRLNIQTETAMLGDREISLSGPECQFLHYLAQHSDRWTSTEELADLLGVDPATVYGHSGKLRTKIETDPYAPVYLRSKRGSGYMLQHVEVVT